MLPHKEQEDFDITVKKVKRCGMCDKIVSEVEFPVTLDEELIEYHNIQPVELEQEYFVRNKGTIAGCEDCIEFDKS